MIPWYSKRIFCHCAHVKGLNKSIFQTLFVIFFGKFRHLVMMLHASIDAACIKWKIFLGSKIFFGAEICFWSYTIIIWGEMCPFKTNLAARKWGWVNPFGQPDRKEPFWFPYFIGDIIRDCNDSNLLFYFKNWEKSFNNICNFTRF